MLHTSEYSPFPNFSDFFLQFCTKIRQIFQCNCFFFEQTEQVQFECTFWNNFKFLKAAADVKKIVLVVICVHSHLHRFSPAASILTIIVLLIIAQRIDFLLFGDYIFCMIIGKSRTDYVSVIAKDYSKVRAE